MATEEHASDLSHHPTAAQHRHQATYEVFKSYVEKHFKRDSRIQSAILIIAQYWDDEADDAVHANVLFSKAECPNWPLNRDINILNRDSSYFGLDFDPYEIQDTNIEWLPWSDNSGATISAFELFCTEDGTQHDDEDLTYKPYAWAYRNGDNMTIEVYGQVLRLDADQPEHIPELRDSWPEDPMYTQTATPYIPPPAAEALFESIYEHPKVLERRIVLGDYLLTQNDPRGELIAAQLNNAHETTNRLLAKYQGDWMGELAKVVCWASSKWELGFLSRAHVLFESKSQAARFLTSPSWSTVRKLSFRSDSLIVFPETLRSIDHLILNPSQATYDLEIPHSVESLEILDTDTTSLLSVLDRYHPHPNLRHLILSGAQSFLSSSSMLPDNIMKGLTRMRQLESLSIGPNSQEKTAVAWHQIARHLNLKDITIHHVDASTDTYADRPSYTPRFSSIYRLSDRTLRLKPALFCHLENTLKHASSFLTELHAHDQVPLRVIFQDSPRYPVEAWANLTNPLSRSQDDGVKTRLKIIQTLQESVLNLTGSPLQFARSPAETT